MSSGESRILIEKTAEYAAKIGDTFIDMLKQKYKHEPNYSFLFPDSPEHQKFLGRISYYKAISSEKAPTRISILFAHEVVDKPVSSPKKEPPKRRSPESVRSPARKPKRKFKDEDISVGIMATLLKSFQGNKEEELPLDPKKAATVNRFEWPSKPVTDKVNKFLDYISSLTNTPIPSREGKHSPKRTRSRSRDEDVHGSYIKRQEKAAAWKELGMREDGQFLPTGDEKRGIGARTESDIYDSYRKKSSQQYRVAAEKRARGEETRGIICYVCKEPGHIARECPTLRNPIN